MGKGHTRDKQAVQIEGTRGNMRDMIRWGEFRFKIGNVDCTLKTYKSDPHEERLFIPLKDNILPVARRRMGRGGILILIIRKNIRLKENGFLT